MDLARLALAAVGLVFVGRLLRTARIYVSWWAYVCYSLAWLALVGCGLLRLGQLAVPALGAVLPAFEMAVFLATAGSLFEHVRADRRRHRDARRLMEQWRLSSGLSRQRAHELEVLATVTAQLVASLDLPQVLQALVDHALRLAGADAVVVYVVEGETGRLRPEGVTAVAARQRTAGQPAPRPQGLTAGVVRSGEPVFIDQVAQHPLFQETPPVQLGALALLPLRFGGAVLGVLNVSYQQPHAFEDERRLLLALADVAALAIHNATQHERLARLAVTDDLTGLSNRRRFLEALRAEAQRARRYQRALSLLMLDLDDLKRINDHYGHAAGDAVLRAVAQTLRDHLRETDLPVRLGGDEFAVLLPETEPEAALHLAERIRAGVAAAATPGAEAVTVSIGLASATGAALPELPRFLRLADEALYQAKAAGRNRVVVASGAPDRAAAFSSSGLLKQP